jgi:hypothetical protein
MRSIAIGRSWRVVAQLAARRVRRSHRVAEYWWNAAVVLLMIAAMNENLLLIGVALCQLMVATRHRRNVEQ